MSTACPTWCIPVGSAYQLDLNNTTILDLKTLY